MDAMGHPKTGRWAAPLSLMAALPMRADAHFAQHRRPETSLIRKQEPVPARIMHSFGKQKKSS
jgi:hypothetical protein